jgi:AcrR family transcriptional regulator
MPHKNYHHGDLKNALIEAGIEILSKEGVNGLSLRKVARKAGVSHAAPYAHFADKQSLIAAIALDGHSKVHARIEEVQVLHPNDPLKQLVHLAWAYMQFGLESPAHYKITFSGLIENEKNYPELVEVTRQSLAALQKIIADCQSAGILSSSEYETEIVAITLWGLIHGLVSLVIESQVSSDLMKKTQPQDMVIAALQQVARVPINIKMLK